jgi:phosphoglycolate phosphatase
VKRAILIDLDGTLIDSRPGIAASCEAALRALGHAPDPSFDITPLIGPPMPKVMARLLESYGDDRIDAGIEAYRAHYGEVGLHMAVMYPGIEEAVRRLAADAVCFVVTSKRAVFAERIVDGLGLAQTFRRVYGTTPDGSLDDKADLIAAVLRAEALDARDAVMVGDRSHDVHGAHANAMRVIGVLWGYGSRAELEAAGADALAGAPVKLVEELSRA